MLKNKSLLILGFIILVIGMVVYHYLGNGIPIVYDLFFKKDIQLGHQDAGTKMRTINILLMGRGGEHHDGPDLTDTIILANINPERNTVSMVSIPRDLWVPSLSAKINEAYADGQDKGSQGIAMSKATVEQVTGQPIDYVVVLDFSGFVKLVDYLGGIDVNVQRTFDDYAYPIEGKEDDLCGLTPEQAQTDATQSAMPDASDIFTCRYKHVHFDKGKEHMDGETALEFVRSRHALGVEGTDFARGRRQQEVLGSVRQKALSLGILLNPGKIVGIYNILKANINTTIQSNEYGDFIKLAQKMEHPVMKSYVIGDQDASDPDNEYGLLVNPPVSSEYKYEWVLAPRVGNGNYSEIKKYISCVFGGNVCHIMNNGIEVNPTLTPSVSPLP